MDADKHGFDPLVAYQRVNHEGTRMRKGARCSRGPVTPPDTANTTAEGASEFLGLTADFADEADEESPCASLNLPVLLFGNLRIGMRAGIASRWSNHGWTRINTDSIPWSLTSE